MNNYTIASSLFNFFNLFMQNQNIQLVRAFSKNKNNK